MNVKENVFQFVSLRFLDLPDLNFFYFAVSDFRDPGKKVKLTEQVKYSVILHYLLGKMIFLIEKSVFFTKLT